MSKSSSDPDLPKYEWLPLYTIAALLGVAYIILLGLFTWIFNYTF